QLGHIKPAGYEIEWTYSDAFSSANEDFRHNATRIFTNNTNFRLPVAKRSGKLHFRIRMVRPDINDFQNRIYGPWSYIETINLPISANDSLNWDHKMSFVEDGKHKQVVTYFDGLLKPKQAQTRFNSKSTQTIISQSLFDYEGREVI